MNKTAVCLLGGLALSLLGSSANAQVFYLNPNNAGANAGSKWKVTMSSLGINTWKVSVTAGGGLTPNFDPRTISMSFRDLANFSVATASATQAQVDKGRDGTGGPLAWSVDSNKTAFGGGFGSSNNKLDNTGLNTFSVILERSSMSAKTLVVSATAEESSARWFGSASLAPEASAVTMLLPALLPVGLMLRRRNRLAKKTL